MDQQETTKHLENKANEYRKRNDIEFAENKKNIHCTLRGDNKYYYAFQCALFTKNLLKFGYGHISKEEIAERAFVLTNIQSMLAIISIART